MKDKLIGVLYFVGIIAVVSLLFVGTTIISEFLLPILETIAIYVFIFLVVICLPLSFIKGLKSVMSFLFTLGSYIFGLSAWEWSFLLCMTIFGTWSVIVGTMLFGVGVIPIGIIACIYAGEWRIVFQLIILVVLTLSAKGYSLRLIEQNSLITY